MIKMFILLFVLVGVPIISYLAYSYYQQTQRALPTPPGVESRTYRNHQQMARVLDNLVHDDMINVVIPKATQQEVRALLSDYYDLPPQLEQDNT